MRLTSIKTYGILATLTVMMSLQSVACDDAVDPAAGAGGGGAGGPATGMGGSGAELPSKVFATFEMASTSDGMFDGHYETEDKSWVMDWFTYTDVMDGKSPMGMITPLEMARFLASDDAAPGRGKVGNAKGGNFLSWGAGLGVNFKGNGAAAPSPVDLSAYKGVRFWAKGTIPSLQVKVVDARNTPVARGGSCTAGATETPKCDDVPIYAAALGTDWKLFEIPFVCATGDTKCFKPGGWANTAYKSDPPQISAVISIQFQVGTQASWDVSVDDVGLLQ